MKGQSWSDKRKQGAILFHPTNPAFADPPGVIPKSRALLLKADRRADAFLIVGRAYNEPQTSNHVEDILLQRDFIID
ncbi:MAG: hypothetical protein LJE64_01875 [Desulfofustis sp.]|nr:hypothetical protein [Desulfofustis sp.]